MSDHYETAHAWASESFKAIATGVSGSIFGLAGGFLGVDLFNESSTYWCFENGTMTAPAGQAASLIDAPPGCAKALELPILGPVFSAEHAGLAIGGAMAIAVLAIAGLTMLLLRKHAP